MNSGWSETSVLMEGKVEALLAFPPAIALPLGGS